MHSAAPRSRRDQNPRSGLLSRVPGASTFSPLPARYRTKRHVEPGLATYPASPKFPVIIKRGRDGVVGMAGSSISVRHSTRRQRTKYVPKSQAPRTEANDCLQHLLFPGSLMIRAGVYSRRMSGFCRARCAALCRPAAQLSLSQGMPACQASPYIQAAHALLRTALKNENHATSRQSGVVRHHLSQTQ